MKNIDSERLRRALAVVAMLGVLAFFAGLSADPRRAWAALLLGNFYFLGLSLFAAVFLAIQRLSSSTWHQPLRRVIVAMGAYFPFGAALTAVLLLGAPRLYPWASSGAAGEGAARTHAVFYSLPFFGARALACLALWRLFGRRLLEERPSKRDAAVFLLVFAVTFSLASVDWLMSLVAGWTSTIFPWYVFGGTLVAGFAALAALAVAERRRGLLAPMAEGPRHDLGKYLFAFSFFWGYLWFSQYLLIWYANLPEEVAFYLAQWSPRWRLWFWSNPVIGFVLPGLLLLSAAAKKDERLLLAAGVAVLAGHWIDLTLLIIPRVLGASASVGWVEVAVFLGLLALYLHAFESARAGAEERARAFVARAVVSRV